jgi:hypothetical protein
MKRNPNQPKTHTNPAQNSASSPARPALSSGPKPQPKIQPRAPLLLSPARPVQAVRPSTPLGPTQLTHPAAQLPHSPRTSAAAQRAPPADRPAQLGLQPLPLACACACTRCTVGPACQPPFPQRTHLRLTAAPVPPVIFHLRRSRNALPRSPAEITTTFLPEPDPEISGRPL